MNKTLKYFSHYIPLVGILIFAAIAFYSFSYEKMFLLGVAIAVSISYFVWGIVHHLIHKELSASIIFEYLAVALLGATILITLVFWI